MKCLIALFLYFFFISCSGRTNNKLLGKSRLRITAEDKTSVDSTHLSNQSILTQFQIKDYGDYSKTFLDAFKAKHQIYKLVTLNADSLIINNDYQNIIIFPKDLPLNKLLIYEKEVCEINYILKIRRINISTLEYNYSEINMSNGDTLYSKNGNADLEPFFYYGTEGTFEDEYDNVFGINKYLDSLTDSCQTIIFVGSGNISRTFLRQNCRLDEDFYITPLLNLKR